MNFYNYGGDFYEVNRKGGSDYYLDEDLMGKLLSMWEAPSKDEIDVWYTLERK